MYQPGYAFGVYRHSWCLSGTPLIKGGHLHLAACPSNPLADGAWNELGVGPAAAEPSTAEVQAVAGLGR
jgi:hypothetical protein